MSSKAKARCLVIVRLIILAAVTWGIWRSVKQARSEFQESGFAFQQIEVSWLVIAGAIYFVGMLPMWLFWLRVLGALGQFPGTVASLRAFYIGHLGKYVPGKAMVVVLRTSLVCGRGVDPVAASVAVFIETLTMMAVGAFVAGFLITFVFGQHVNLQILALAIMLATGIPLLPPVFRRIVWKLKLSSLSSEMARSVDGLTYRLMAFGFVCNCVGWTLLGVSLWATLQAMPLKAPVSHFINIGPRLVASVSLAMVAGFLSLLPGGVGVRELVLDTLLAPSMKHGHAIAVAVLLRLVWLATELLAALVLYWLPLSGQARSQELSDRS